MAKATCWAITDAEARKRGEQIGLDTLVVRTKCRETGAEVNTLSTPPE